MVKQEYTIKGTNICQSGYVVPNQSNRPWFEYDQMARILNELYWKWNYDEQKDAFRVVNDDETSTFFYGFDFITNEGIRHVYPFRDKNIIFEAHEYISCV